MFNSNNNDLQRNTRKARSPIYQRPYHDSHFQAKLSLSLSVCVTRHQRSPNPIEQAFHRRIEGWSKIEPFIPPPLLETFRSNGIDRHRLLPETFARYDWRPSARSFRVTLIETCETTNTWSVYTEERGEPTPWFAHVVLARTGSTTSWWKWWARINIARTLADRASWRVG